MISYNLWNVLKDKKIFELLCEKIFNLLNNMLVKCLQIRGIYVLFDERKFI